MDSDKILQYLRATTNLYGIVTPEKVVEIYNQQNKDKITTQALEAYKALPNEYFEYTEGYFAHEAVFVNDSVTRLEAEQGDKPYYIPNKTELLKFADDFYVEDTVEFRKLYAYIKEYLVSDAEMALGVVEDIQLCCAFDFSIQSALAEFERRRISFASFEQAQEVISLITDLANNTRIWENRGHTPKEIFEKYEKPHLRPLPKNPFTLPVMVHNPSTKVGRNDPCPCGSGKKYKKCCLDSQ